MKTIFITSILITSLILTSCSEGEVSQTRKHFTPYTTQTGDILVTDEILGTIEGEKTSTLSFRTNGILSQLSVHRGTPVKKGQILARLENNEPYIRESGLKNIQTELDTLTFTTNALQFQTEGIKDTTETLYDTRLESLATSIKILELNIEKARQNLNNQKEGLGGSFTTFANDFDRIATNLLFEGDRILGISTNFEYTNDGWEPYLGARAGSSQVEAKNLWNSLYAARGTIRKYTQSGSTLSNIGNTQEDLRLAYIQARNYTQSMSYMFENSVLGKDLSQERLDGWINAWKGFGSEAQGSEAGYIAWKNGTKNIVSTSGSGSIADKDITSLELELENLKLSQMTLKKEKEAKLQEVKTNVTTVAGKKGELRIQSAENTMNANLTRESYEYAILRAPFDGTILETLLDEGSFVGVGQGILRISKGAKKIIKIYIDNTLYEYKIGDIIRLDTTEKTTLTGSIILVQEQRDPLYNKNYVEISVPADLNIGDKVTIHPQRKKSQLLNGTIIPLSAIITKYGPPGVYILKDQAAKYQFVEIIRSDMSYAEVLGIPEGSIIITEGKEHIYDGEKLE